MFLLTLTAPGNRRHRRSPGVWCPCTPDGGVQAAFWNAAANGNWNDFVTYMRRRYGDVQYARAAEVQKRGLLHFHVLLRVRDSNRLLDDYGRMTSLLES